MCHATPPQGDSGKDPISQSVTAMLYVEETSPIFGNTAFCISQDGNQGCIVQRTRQEFSLIRSAKTGNLALRTRAPGPPDTRAVRVRIGSDRDLPSEEG